MGRPMASARSPSRPGASDVGTATTSSAGRLFDAAAALVLGIEQASFEGQGPMMLEAIAEPGLRRDPAPRRARRRRYPAARLGAAAADARPTRHLAAAAARRHLSRQPRARRSSGRSSWSQPKTPFDAVGLTGGVFQNRLLAERVIALLAACGIAAHLPETVPANDGGLAFGQIVEAAALLRDPAPVMIEDTHVTLAHGNGGRFMRELIEEIFARHLANPALDVHLDAAPLALDAGMTPFVTTDAFTVQPLEFPGGDIGSLAVNGTVNDLAVSGATPLYLTLNAIIEEGLEFAQLDRIVASLAAAARAASVAVVAGDTKVVPRGQGGGLYLATTGIGLRPSGLRARHGPHRGRATASSSAARSATTASPSCWRASSSTSPARSPPTAPP